MENISTATAFVLAKDSFEIAEEQFRKGEFESLKEEYPRMRETILKGLEKLREVAG